MSKSTKDIQDELKKKAGVKPELTPAEEGVKAAKAEAKKAPEKSPEKPEVEDKPKEVPTTEETAVANVETVQPAEIHNGQLMLTDKHKQLIKEQIAPDATQAELDLFFMMAYRTRLDPLMRQLYFIKYRNKKKSERNGCRCGWNKCTCGKSEYDVSYVTSIDGYRIIAHRTGDFGGIDEPKYHYDEKGKLTHCTVKVYRRTSDRPFAATVKFSEYNTGKNMWGSMPETMIAKVAEAHALRKAFPQDLSGIYTTDEMDQAKRDNPEPEKQVPMITKKQVAEIKDLMDQKGVTIEQLKDHVKRNYRKTTMANVTKPEAQKIINKLRTMPDAHNPLDDVQEHPDDEDTFEDFVERENEEKWAEDDLDLDEIDEGIKAMNEKNDAKPGAKYKESIQ